MNINQFIQIIRVRFKTILLTFILTVAAVIFGTLLLPKNYRAVTTIILNYTSADPITGASIPAQLIPGYMATQVDIINNKNNALRVADALKLTELPALKEKFNQETNGVGNIRDWIADLLLKNLKTIYPEESESSIIYIMFQSTDPEFAALVANTFAKVYQETNVRLRTQAQEQTHKYFSIYTQNLLQKLTAAKNKLSQYQKEKNISSSDYIDDVETVHFSNLSNQSAISQNQSLSATSSKNSLHSENNAAAPTILSNPLIQNLQHSLLEKEASLSKISIDFDQNHPIYQQAEAQIKQLKTTLNEQIKLASKGIENNSTIVKNYDSQVKQALTSQKNKLMNLNVSRSDLSSYLREVQDAQNNYDLAIQRLSKNNIERQFNQSEAAILNPATPPVFPTDRKLILRTLLSLALGLLLGIGAGISKELLDRYVRCEQDLIDLGTPILGVIKYKKPRRRILGF